MVRRQTKKSKKGRTTKRRDKLIKKTAPIDLIQAKMKRNQRPERGRMDLEELKNKPYCNECDLYFINEHAKETHSRTKGHKRRLKIIKIPYHNMKNAEEAAGLF